MHHSVLVPIFFVLAAGLAPLPEARAEITLIGKASLSGTAHDLSNLKGKTGGVPADRLGSFGSAITSLGHDNLYLAADDRGPGNGDWDFRCRFQTFEIVIDPAATETVRVRLVQTTLLRTETDEPLTGNKAAIDAADDTRSLRFDPEGIRLSRTGTAFVSDEYGPSIDEFSIAGSDAGKRLRRFAVPEKFRVSKPFADPEAEFRNNTKGRQPNKGFEGLATSPDGTRIYALLQDPLIQDHAREGAEFEQAKKLGHFCRILELGIETGATREFVYPLEKPKHGVNELLAINDHEFLVIERDSGTGAEAAMRALYRIDIAGATDVSAVESLPARDLPPSIRPVAKSLFLDFTDTKYTLAGPGMPEKIEGLTWGPTLADGRRTLIVTVDNDLKAEVPNWFWVFGIDPVAGSDR